MFYTDKEKTEKKYTIKDVEAAAKIIVKDRTNDRVKSICVNSIAKVNSEDLFTLVEMNNYTQQVIKDTFYYSR